MYALLSAIRIRAERGTRVGRTDGSGESWQAGSVSTSGISQTTLKLGDATEHTHITRARYFFGLRMDGLTTANEAA